MKSFSAIACLVLVAGLVAAAPSEARPKRSVLVAAAPVVASVATVPVVHSHVVHSNPTTVVKTQQVNSGDSSSYSYSTETKTQPAVVQTHSAVVAAAPVATAVAAYHPVAAAAVVPSAYHYGYYGYPSVYTHYASPYSYVVGK